MKSKLTSYPFFESDMTSPWTSQTLIERDMGSRFNLLTSRVHNLSSFLFYETHLLSDLQSASYEKVAKFEKHICYSHITHCKAEGT